MENVVIKNSGKNLRLVSSTAAVVLWISFAYANYMYPDDVSTPTRITIGMIVLLSISGLCAAVAKKPLLMLLIFLVSFFPVGLYLLGVPSIFRLIGITNVLFLVSSLLMLSARYRIQIWTRS